MRDTSVARPERDFTFIQTAKARSFSPEGLFNCSLDICPDEDQSTIHVARRAPLVNSLSTHEELARHASSSADAFAQRMWVRNLRRKAL